MPAVVLFAGDLAACEQVVGQVGGRIAIFFGNAVAFEHLAERGKNDFHVAQEGDVLDVFQIVVNLGFPGHCIATVHLSKAAKSLAHGMAFALFRGHEYHVAHELGPGSDYGHVALEDVEEFGELVEAGGAEELAVGVQAHVVGEQVPLRVTLVGHGAELDELENLFVKAGARLRKEGVALHFDCTNEGECHEERAQADNGQERAAEIKDSF